MDTSHRPLRLLSLDGGGIRGISELVILNEIMHRVQKVEKLSSVPLPADYFDLMGGTSTGGLIVILLGRLRLTVPEAIEHYRVLAKQIFSERKSLGKDGKFKASNLEKAIKLVIEQKLGPGHAEERMFETDGKPCKTFVCAVPATNINKEPRLFRTWLADKNPGFNCTIWEACRATSAAPTFFKRIKIGEPGLEEAYIDAGVGFNNPVKYVVEEAGREFGSEREIGCIVSIGTGKSKLSSFEDPNLFQRILPLDLIKVLKIMATESESAAKEMKRRFQGCPGLYQRLNVESGLDSISLEEWERISEVRSHTENYIREDQVGQEIDTIVSALVGKPLRLYAIQQLGGSAPIHAQDQYYFIFPKHRVDYFVPRQGPMEEIHRQFEQPRSGATPKVVVLLGMGGCGKSQLALEHCQMQQMAMYSAIFWVDATSPANVEQGFTSIAAELSIPDLDTATGQAKVQFVLKKINSWQISWLFVFDNFDDPGSFNNKNIKEYFPQGAKGSILFTSRHAAASSLGHVIDMSTMSEKEAIELLFRGSQANKSHEDLEEGRKVVKRIGFHALAVDQASTYIQTRNLDIRLYLNHFNDHMEKVLNEVPDLWDYKRKLEDNPEVEKKLTVFTTWELSFALISGEGKMREDKEHLLSLLAFFDSRDLSSSLFGPYSSTNTDFMPSCILNDSWSEYELQGILRELRNLSLIQSFQVQASGASISLHPLVQDWIKARLSPESRRTYTIEASLILGKLLENLDKNDTTLSDKQTLHNHLEAVLLNRKIYLSHSDVMDNATLLQAGVHFIQFLRHLGYYKSAETVARDSLRIAESLQGREHNDTIQIMHGLALTLRRQDRDAEAELFFREVVAAREKSLGKDDPKTLNSIAGLAGTLISQKRYSEAESILQSAVVLARSDLGNEHRQTSFINETLAFLFLDQERYDEAEHIYRDSIQQRQERYGQKNTQIVTSMHNLAYVLVKKGQRREAEMVYREVLAIEDRYQGKEHPETLSTMHNLADVLVESGRNKEAEVLYRETLTMRQKILGKEHQSTLVSLNNLAVCLDKQGNYNEAGLLYRETLAIRQRVLGKEHQRTLISLGNLAVFLNKQGNYDEAELLYREALAIRQKVLGKEHQDTLAYLSTLALCLDEHGNYNEAEPLFRETLAIRRNVLGKEHQDTLVSLSNLAMFLAEQGKHNEAESFYRELISTQEEVLGKNHESTLESRDNLATLLEQRAKSSKSRRLPKLTRLFGRT